MKEKEYKLELFLPPNFNPHHPEGGWIRTAEGSYDYCLQLSQLNNLHHRIIKIKE